MSDFLDYQGLQRYHKKAVKAFEFSVLIPESDWANEMGTDVASTSISSENFINDDKYIYIVSYSSEKYGIKMKDITTSGVAELTAIISPTEDITANILRLEVHGHG